MGSNIFTAIKCSVESWYDLATAVCMMKMRHYHHFIFIHNFTVSLPIWDEIKDPTIKNLSNVI